MSVDVTKPEKYVVEDVNNKALYKPEVIIEEGGDAYTIICDNGRSFLLYYNSKGNYIFREKTQEELSKEANEYLDETLGTINSKPSEDNPCNQLGDSLKKDLQRVHEALKDSLLKVEAQAFALFVKENKGTNIAEDYYNFRKSLK